MEDFLKELKEEYYQQGNRCTAYPIYVTVQELQFVAVGREGYSSCGDTEEVYEYTHPDNDCGGTWKSKEEVVDWLKDYHEYEGKQLRREIDNIEELLCIYKWTDVEVFLTVKGAEEYLRCNQHNLGKTRTYVRHFSNRNFEMRSLMKEIGLDKEG